MRQARQVRQIRQQAPRALAAALLAAAVCVPAGLTAPRARAASTGGTLVVAQSTDASTLDPQKQGKMPDMSILSNIFDTLVTRDAHNKLAPSLATSWRALNTTTWEFKLRQGVKFQDGEPFNATVVKFSIDRLLDPKTKSPIVELRPVKGVKVVNASTVDFLLKAPDPILPNQLTLFGGVMVPPAYIRRKGDAYFAAHPVGTGPFTFVSWQKDSQLVLAANAAYWRGAPTVRRLIFKPIPNEADMVAALKTGDVDIAANISADAAAQLQGAQGVRVVSTPSIRTYYVVLDTTHGGPLANVRVRQALNYAVDANAIVKALLGGYGRRAATLVPQQSFGYDPSVAPYPYDPQKAKSLLAAAGYRHGFTIRLDAQSIDHVAVEAIAAELKTVGVNVQLNLMDPGTFTEKLLANQLGAMYYRPSGKELDGV